ncbi:hypothetical protein CI238_06933, partial [Colletotrichum incanum]
LRRSRIIRLPNELLLCILQALATGDLYMLRQVSFTLWRIYQNQYMKGRLKPIRQPVLHAKQHAFCAACSKRKTSPAYWTERMNSQKPKSMYWSYCNTPHSRLTFSVQQRKEPSETRRCISSDAFIRLCPHLTVSRSCILEEFKKLGSDRTKESWRPRNFAIRICHQCKDSALLKTIEDKRRYVEPPAFSLFQSPIIKDDFYIHCGWSVTFYSSGRLCLQ